MPALDDYAPPVPLWFVVLASILALDAGKGVSATQAAAEVQHRVPGRYQRRTSTSELCRRMLADGIVRVVRVEQLGAITATFYAVTSEGRDVFGRAIDQARSATSTDLPFSVWTVTDEGATKPRRKAATW